MRFSLLVVVLSAISLSAYGDSLKDFNKAIGDLNQSLSKGNRTQPKPVQAPPNIAAITPEQQDKIAQALAKRIADKKVMAMIDEAAPTIKDYVERLSCIADGRGSGSLNVFAAPGVGFDNHYAPMVFMKYHNKAACLSVVRIHGWVAPALNALKFEVVYVADDSGESVKTNHQIVKQPDGNWLFTR